MLDKALALAQANRLQDAAALYARLLQDKPRNATVLRAAISFHNRYSRNFRAGVPLVATLLTLRPKDAVSHQLAAETFINCARFRLAKEHADKAVALAPHDPDSRFIAAVVATQTGDHVAALAHIDAALARQPDHVPTLVQKGRVLRSAGDLAGAEALCRAELQKRPTDINLLEVFVSVTLLRPDDPILVNLLGLRAQYEQLGGAALANYLRLLAKAATDCDKHDEAFALVQQAKAVAPMRHDPSAYAQFVTTLCQTITRADYFGVSGDASMRPLLIVGMPRTGSTLIEQILSSHPDVASVGESPSLSVIVQDMRVRRHQGPDMVQAIRQMPTEAAQSLAARYLDETAREDAARVIDKSLHNFELLGVFARLFPQARIIHVLRDPLDTCVSCYMQRLSAWHGYTQDLAGLGRYYGQYRRLMAHWENVLPNKFLHVRYEDLVADTEIQARRMITFADLPWDARCLDYASSDTKSLTLSAAQVREPINSRSIGRWRRYGDALQPLKTALAAYYPDGIDALARTE